MEHFFIALNMLSHLKEYIDIVEMKQSYDIERLQYKQTSILGCLDA